MTAMVMNQPEKTGQFPSVHSFAPAADGSRRPAGLLTPHLADLRCYARVISVSQRSADSLVYAALSVLVEDHIDSFEIIDQRLVMFRTFHDIWFFLQRVVEPVGKSLDRAVYCLTVIESFSIEDTAFITRRYRTEIPECLAHLKAISCPALIMNDDYEDINHASNSD